MAAFGLYRFALPPRAAARVAVSPCALRLALRAAPSASLRARALSLLAQLRRDNYLCLLSVSKIIVLISNIKVYVSIFIVFVSKFKAKIPYFFVSLGMDKDNGQRWGPTRERSPGALAR